MPLPSLLLARFAAALTTAAPVPAAPTNAPVYVVAFKVLDGGVIVAQPTLTVAAAEASEWTISPKEEARYDLKFSVTPGAAGTLSFTGHLAVDSPAAGHVVADPALHVRAHETNVIEVGEQSATHTPVRIEFTVEPEK